MSLNSFDANDITFGPGPFDVDGETFSVFAGYNFAVSQFILGVELSYNFGGMAGDDGSFMNPFEVDSTFQAEVRAGYALDNVLPYLTVGVVSSDFFSNHGGFGAANQNFTGYSVGVGVDYGATDQIVIRAEIEQVMYDTDNFDFGGGDLHEFEIDGTRFTLGAAFRF
ncbi:outer membrane beta-barrel protein [Rhodobacteraceae bacterium N5(2021)]|uniref:Outer membrane beta-barrel protein n=1 Tax=Gymnodinialimonas phycosphaerae TaxID=2841589 RepID=A0A975TYT3_9RHOB|nr:outer membrane beta-barrel protein [Gymnodinialimonas phycosphaerae]